MNKLRTTNPRILDTGRRHSAGDHSSPICGRHVTAEVRTIPCDVARPVSHLRCVDEWVVQSEDGLHLYQLRGL